MSSINKNRIIRYIPAIVLAVVVMLLILVMGINNSRTRLTYREYQHYIDANEISVVISSPEEVLEQDFEMPYEVINGVSIRIGTFGRDNNSDWNIEIVEKETGNVVYSKLFDASLLADNFLQTFEFDENVSVTKGDMYTLRISSANVQPGSQMQFWCADGYYFGEGATRFNGNVCPYSLSMSVWGGEKDNWWLGFFLLEWFVLLGVIVRCFYVQYRGKKCFSDPVTIALVLGVVLFFLRSLLVGVPYFFDESDNFAAAMTIIKGGVIYRDYYTQHTPVLYYLCSLFALLGANSIEQFRLSYYFFESAIWALIFLRNYKNIGIKKMLLLPIVEVIAIPVIIAGYGSQVLSDSLQGLCFSALILEFIAYIKDRKINWGRSIIVSICIWGSLGAAFVSAFSLVWVVLGVLVVEIIDAVKNKTLWLATVKRLSKVIVSVIVPPVIAVLYFKINGCLSLVYNQAYLFNRDVYPIYNAGYGSNMFSPFFYAIRYYFLQVSSDINLVLQAGADTITLLRLCLLIASVGISVVLLLKKKKAEILVPLFMMICAASRGYGFHGIAAWYIAVLLVVIYLNQCFSSFGVYKKTAVVLVSLILLGNFVVEAVDSVDKQQVPIDSLSDTIVRMTTEGEEIFFDESVVDPMYVFYKGRGVVNRVPYMLPWNMDEFEQECIDDLLGNAPNIVVYNEQGSSWGVAYGSNRFVDTLKENYTRISDDPNVGWPYLIWVRN